MLVLGIETSCDETAVAVVDDARRILANHVFSQLEEHRPYAGVVPEIAARAHADRLDGMIGDALKEAGISFSDLNAVAATAGPGLIGGLIVGVMTGKVIASVHKKPFIAVNHLEGHALTARLTSDVAFPYLLLLVSGGHCQFLLAEGVGRYKKLGGTIDDALGEAFDKTAKMIELGYPGGPAVETLAQKGNPKRFVLPAPLKGRDGCDFSFAGLKTAIRNEILRLKPAFTEQDKADMCASFQHVVGEVIEDRLRHAITMAREHVPSLSQCVIAGGVAANQYLKQKMERVVAQYGCSLVVPPAKLCTDNAAMIAWAGLERFRLNEQDPLTFEPRARWPLC